MSSYQRYRQARDLAWQVLLRLEIRSLPVDVRKAAQKMGVEVLDMPAPQASSPAGQLLEGLGKAPCRSLQIRGKWYIFLKAGALDDQRAHFALAHELGHILLRHETRTLSRGVRAHLSRENPGDLQEEPDSPWDYEADIFAIRLLAPACVLRDLQAHTPGRVMALAGLPPRAAAIRAERMALLNQRNAYFSHPLERKVYEQFGGYIRGIAPASPEPVPPPDPACPPDTAPGPRQARPFWPEKKASGLLPPAFRPPAPETERPRRRKRIVHLLVWAGIAGALAGAILLLILLTSA